MKRILIHVCTLVVALCASPTMAEGDSKTSELENFALLDHEGKFHELDYYFRVPGVKGIVLFIQGNGCPLVQKRVPELRKLKARFQKKGILFGMLNANLQDERDEIAAEAKEYRMELPVLIDDTQRVARMLGIKRTAEAFLIDAKTKSVVYRGAIDDRMSYQKERPVAKHHYLKEAIQSLLAGEKPIVTSTDSPGCKVSFPDDNQEITYVEHVAPILKTKCVVCHTKGGLGPFAMSSYKKAKGWSDMIAEVVLTRQMPPWHADPHIGRFYGDAGISPEEARTLITWAKAGCPRGQGEDPLLGYKPEIREWHLGKPDRVVELPEQKVAAEGVFDYRYVTLDNPFREDVWLTGTEISPGNTRVLHHVIVTAHHPRNRRRESWITGYAPGTQGSRYPDDSAVKLPAGWKLRFQLHYTASGKPETDVTRLGLHFTRTPVEKEFKTGIVLNSKFRIPPGALDFGVHKDFSFRRDSKVYALNPHMHYRGKSMRFDAHFPDGKKEPLLSVPNYNFNWQRTYVLDKPLDVPAGTRIRISNAWDNSAANPHNPDPSRAVGWGEQSFDEMFFATIGYVEE